MENQNKNTLSKKLVDESLNVDSTNPTKPYVTAESLFNTEQYGPDFLNMADPAALLNTERYQSDMFKYGPEVLGNLSSPEPGIVDSGYNPMRSSVDTLDIDKRLTLQLTTPSDEVLPISDPILSNVKKSNFERYYRNPKYNELGFHPYQNNEPFYNANSSKMDDLARAYNQLGRQFCTGFFASYNAIGDMFDGDGYVTSPDLVGASSMEDAMRIGSTSRGGAFGTVTNLGLSFGYTAGIITNIALEELVLAAGSTAISMTGAGAPAGFGAFLAGTGRNLYRTAQSIGNVFDGIRYASASRALAKSFNNIQTARQVFKGGLGFAGRVFAPEVTNAITKWKTTGNTAQNLLKVIIFLEQYTEILDKLI